MLLAFCRQRTQAATLTTGRWWQRPGSFRLVLRIPGGGKQQEYSGRVEQQRHHKDEPPQDRLVVGADERRQIFDRPQVGLDSAALALDRGLLDFQVGKVNDDSGRGVKTEGARTSAPVGGGDQ